MCLAQSCCLAIYEGGAARRIAVRIRVGAARVAPEKLDRTSLPRRQPAVLRAEGDVNSSKSQEAVVSNPQSVLRGWLIERFVDEQKATHEYLLLTEDRGPSRRVPPSLVVAAQWAWLRQKAGTIPEEVQRAEIDLMYAVSVGMFPELLMMHRTTSIELRQGQQPEGFNVNGSMNFQILLK